MSPSHVLRIVRSDGDGSSFILVHATPSVAKNTKPLDVKLVATEGENPYVVALQHAAIADLKVPGSPCSSSEWEQILESVLFERQVLEDIQLTAALRADRVQITVRKKAQGITQRLGIITLQKDEEEEDSDVTQWCGIAIASREGLKEELVSVRAKTQELEQAVSALSSQLEELMNAKRDHEAALLDKFRLLLNEKKARIREQQDIIRSGNLGPDALAPVQSSPEHSPSQARAPALARRHKRKTPTGQPAGNDGDSNNGDSPQEMELDSLSEIDIKDRNAHGLSEDQHTTDDGDSDATASEPDEHAVGQNKASESRKKQGGPSAAKDTGRVSKSPSPAPSRHTKPLATRSQRSAYKASREPSTLADAGSETDSDDEL
ncbi:hypothetical protein GGTG_10350 [Gaeumannomyces tritici R3-111a-1]|uniref:XRCC4 coiled-coil domain-containing protein n=1 Tax=Gaeumannomyces tritici (strain R3-111a-1) TaxID=644352 RepID=J3PA27_GAET3|nr:hypothetical protein GGTG_10350 [Gaeumannomyces tritici R3-111a-1]EJT73513.1 hypothetical protein GGTG_10350 [Gaeumannomyces tritici R3-111a-1]